MSDLLTAAAAALGIPEALIERSAAARATANGTTVDEVLAAWSGGAAVAATPAPAPTPDIAPEPEVPAAEAAPAAVATIEVPLPAPVVVAAEPEPVEPIEPVPFGRRMRTATRVGAWTGAALGLFGFLVASAFWAVNATVSGEDPYTPVIQTDSTRVIIGAALVSILFGAIVAGLSRASAGWANPGMRLSNSARSTAWLGAFIGLLLGVIAGALLTSGFGTPVEEVEGTVQLPVLPTVLVMLIGGAVLGAITAAATQAVGVPVAVEDIDEEEIDAVRGRLGGALSIPLLGLAILALLVVPFAWALIESNHLSAGAAAIVAIVAAGGILGFAALAGSRPNVRISFGEAMVALIGIGMVLVLVLAVLFARSAPEDEDTGEEHARSAVVLII